MTVRSYERPRALDDALALLSGRPRTVLAGGTDIYPAAAGAFAWGQPSPDDILDITAIEGLGAIEETERHFRIGCLVTWTQLIDSDLPDWFECLRRAGRDVGGVQIQNRATLVGNICNASPAADGVPALLALDAEIELACTEGIRVLPFAEFVRGNRRTARRPAELATAILIPKRGGAARSTFVKLGARRYLVISIAMVAILIDIGRDGCVAASRIAVGSCSEVAQRLPALEAALIGRPADAQLDLAVSDDMLSPLAPIDDIRASAAYRGQSAGVIVQRALSILFPGVGASS